MARFCFVFNCQSSIQVEMISKFFKGLASNGSWVSFDEFNRLEIGILSVISQIIIQIQTAKRQQLQFIKLDSTFLPFKQACSCFITLNPYYQGRTPLPDSLKSLFRTITMVVPDLKSIIEIMLYSCGFQDAENLSSKLVYLYRLTNEQVKFCQHYDFGLRSIKTNLMRAGELKLRALKIQSDAELQFENANQVLENHIQKLSKDTQKKILKSGNRGNDFFKRQRFIKE